MNLLAEDEHIGTFCVNFLQQEKSLILFDVPISQTVEKKYRSMNRS